MSAISSGTTLQELVTNETISIYSVPTLFKAVNIINNEGDPITTPGTRGYWIYGPPGTGKTHLVHSLFPGCFVKQQNKWWDGYQGEEVVLLDDLDSNVLGHYLKIWMDKWPARGEVKGGTIPLRHRRFIVTANYLPSELWPEDQMMAEAISRRCTMWKKTKRSKY
jgi:ATP-dependent 26S proteasome regulatory subunit